MTHDQQILRLAAKTLQEAEDLLAEGDERVAMHRISLALGYLRASHPDPMVDRRRKVLLSRLYQITPPSELAFIHALAQEGMSPEQREYTMREAAMVKAEIAWEEAQEKGEPEWEAVRLADLGPDFGKEPRGNPKRRSRAKKKGTKKDRRALLRRLLRV